MSLLALKSGSDIRGTAYGEHSNLTPAIVSKIAIAYVQFLERKYSIPKEEICISIGRDSRITGEMLAQAFADGISSVGATAILFGMCSTPSMYHCLIHQSQSYTASVMVTASHHPFDKNGLKFFAKDGGLNSKDIGEILELADTLKEPIPQNDKIHRENYLQSYVQDLKNTIINSLNLGATPLTGMKIVVDAGNGAGGFYAKMLQELGADTKGSQFLEPDGHFPNHAPNPENADAMKSLSLAVLKNGANLGVIFDADCDRAAIVDNAAKEINRNRLIALIARILLDKKRGSTIVTDSVTSTGLSKFIERFGGNHHRFKRGYRNVIDEAIRLNQKGINTPLAIETSGHCALRDNHYLDDGMYLATQLIINAKKLQLQGKVLGDLIAELEEPVESTERRLQILTSDFRSLGNNIIAKLTSYFEKQENCTIATPNYEGLRVEYDLHGKKKAAWFLLRLSVHDPVMPLNIESDFAGVIPEILQSLQNLLKDESELDISALNEK